MIHPPLDYAPPFRPPERVRRNPRLDWLAVIVAASALTIALVAIMRAPTTVSSPAASPLASQTDDRKLCEAVGPLLKESLDIGNRFRALGPPGTPARDAGISAFHTDVTAWQKRIQTVLDDNVGPPDFLIRQVQIYSDQLVLYSDNIAAGPATELDALAWSSGSVALGGAMQVCVAFGIEFWK